MRRTFAAACAALMLMGSLTACGTTGAAMDTPNNNSVNRTSYSAKNTKKYPDGSDLDRGAYRRMTDSRTSQPYNNGKYTAYSNGSVSQSGGTDALTRGVKDMGKDVKNAGKDLMEGAKDLMRDTDRNVRSMGGVPNGNLE